MFSHSKRQNRWKGNVLLDKPSNSTSACMLYIMSEWNMRVSKGWHLLVATFWILEKTILHLVRREGCWCLGLDYMYIFTRVHPDYHVTRNVIKPVYTSCGLHILQLFSELKKENSKGVSLISSKSIKLSHLCLRFCQYYVLEHLCKLNNKLHVIS